MTHIAVIRLIESLDQSHPLPRLIGGSNLHLHRSQKIIKRWIQLLSLIATTKCTRTTIPNLQNHTKYNESVSIHLFPTRHEKQRRRYIVAYLPIPPRPAPWHARIGVGAHVRSRTRTHTIREVFEKET